MEKLDRIPEVVAIDHLFPLLQLHDLLRLRRVSRALRSLVGQYIRKVKHTTEVEINEKKDRNLNSFLQVGFAMPVSHLYLNVTSRRVFETEEFVSFVNEYGTQITHLKVKNFPTCLSSEEIKVFEGFKCLESLEIEEIDTDGDPKIEEDDDSDSDDDDIDDLAIKKESRYCFPKSFQNLKSLKLGKFDILNQNGAIVYAEEFLGFCDKLEQISHPLSKSRRALSNLGFFSVSSFDWVIDRLVKQAKNSETCANEHPLKFYDLENYQHEIAAFPLDFLRLVHLSYQNKVKLMNVDASLFETVDPSMIGQFEPFNNTVVSVVNLAAPMFMMDLPNLEKIVITSTGLCSFNDEWSVYPAWPNLKVLDVTIDSMVLCLFVSEEDDDDDDDDDDMPSKTSELLDFLFLHSDRDSLEELNLRFSESVPVTDKLPYPKAFDMFLSCSNVKKLTLTNWPGTNKSLSILWQNMNFLEEVCLGNCKLLGNVGFVGENKETPTFLSLTRLKKLTLKGLDKMPKITDTVFNLVIRHLKLTHLYIHSSTPLQTITAKGIASMLTGVFANSIEKFPFREWSIYGVNAKSFKKLGSRFRSSKML